MNDILCNILQQVKNGELSLDEAKDRLVQSHTLDLGFANLDLARRNRCGTGEVIYAASKTLEQLLGIAEKFVTMGEIPILFTRLAPDAANRLQSQWGLRYDAVSRIGVIGDVPAPSGLGTVAVVTAGTSDIPVAEEAVKTLEFLGNAVDRIYDVGVAGIHRLFAKLDRIRAAQVIIAIAGMEGALASVVAGVTDVPVIAVPTSVGYGAAFQGMAALLSMLNSCAAGVSVVNIDNGFGAAYIASRINHTEKKP